MYLNLKVAMTVEKTNASLHLQPGKKEMYCSIKCVEILKLIAIVNNLDRN